MSLASSAGTDRVVGASLAHSTTLTPLTPEVGMMGP
jgi:hypothetical protein